METTSRLSLPLLLAGQAQKELAHNEALQILDMVTCAAVEEPPRSDPPVQPSPGSCYIVGTQPTGAWAAQANALAAFTPAGWRFVAPVEGMDVLVRTAGVLASFRAGSWTMPPSVADPIGGTQVDAEARAAISALLAALRLNGLIAS